jgi:rhamnopyranosyl-N-acetylglucosaminyl-diphospho-decaprenol beta-1,3/1,4-galactofuranosyltransferase
VEAAQRRILTVVLTHNAPDSLARCLDAIVHQTEPPDAILVVDNASHPPAMLPTELTSSSSIVRSEENTGPAGGYALGLKHFLDSGFDHAWVLDDDMIPQPDCLERLWALASVEPESAFVFPMSRQRDGAVGEWPSWCGFLVARQIIDTVGLPMSELFWWAEDTEYLQWRIPEAGFARRVVRDAIVDHDPVRQGSGVPLWKYYYESRNMLYVHLHVKHRVGRYPRNVTKLFGRALLREHGGRLRRMSVMMRGLSDGARGRLGILYPVEPMHEHVDDGSGTGQAS